MSSARGYTERWWVEDELLGKCTAPVLFLPSSLPLWNTRCPWSQRSDVAAGVSQSKYLSSVWNPHFSLSTLMKFLSTLWSPPLVIAYSGLQVGQYFWSSVSLEKVSFLWLTCRPYCALSWTLALQIQVSQ